MGTGRSGADPENNYGTKTVLQGGSYMFSLTSNASGGAFNDPNACQLQVLGSGVPACICIPRCG